MCAAEDGSQVKEERERGAVPSSFLLSRDGEDARSLLREGRAALESCGVPDPATDAACLLEAAAGIPALRLRAEGELRVPPSAAEIYRALLRRRCAREPLQYILGEAPFMGRMFRVCPDVLIPRFDTEVLCEQALCRAEKGSRILDLCTGSGILAVTLALDMPGARVYGGDISAPALKTARENALRLGAAVDFRRGDLFSPFEGMRFGMIVSNPPYIPVDEMERLQEEVRREPALALAAGEDGLMFYCRIAREAPAFLEPGGWLLLEIGCGQARQVEALLRKQAFCNIEVYRDLQGLDRVICARNNGRSSL